MRHLVLLLCACFVVNECITTGIDSKAAFQVAVVSRTVDLSSQIVKENLAITLERTATATESSDFYLAFEPEKLNHLAHIQATPVEGKGLLKTEVVDLPEKKNLKFVKIALPKLGDKFRFNVKASYVNYLKPYPTHVRQRDKQLMVYQDNHYVYLPYSVKKQKLVVKLFADGVPESYSKRIKPVDFSGRTITYGPYGDVEPFAKQLLRVHFESNAPFLVTTKQTRLVEVYHWGNIAVEEQLEVRHVGAELKGSFSRLDYQRDYREDKPSVAQFTMTLPAGARDIYYRDEIGNISTSAVRQLSDSVKLLIMPRFPLFGGWKTTFTVGYNVPSEEFLKNSGDHFCLKMKLIDRIYDEFVSENFMLKVILPELASDIVFDAPYEVQQDEQERHFTYLDTVGRPTVVVRKRNLVPAHLQDFQLCYTWQRMKLVREPLMVTTALLILFLSIIVFVRLDFSLTKNAQHDNRLKLDGLMDKICDLQNHRQDAYDQWVGAVESCCSQKDVNALTAARKRVEQDLKSLSQQISTLQTECKSLSADAVEKVASLQRNDRTVRDLIGAWQQEAERYATGKINRQVYGERSATLQAKLNEVREKNAQLLHSI